MGRNFNKSWPVHLTFSNMINLYPNIWFIETSKCQQSYFEKRSRQKKYKFFIFLKRRYDVLGGPIDMNGVFWETSVGFLESVILQLLQKYSQSNVNLNVKSRAKLNCL